MVTSHLLSCIVGSYFFANSSNTNNELQRILIVVTDSGKPRTRYGKYIEVPSCNTVLAGDLPLDNADDYSYLIKLDLSMSDKEIENKLIEYLKSEEKYEEKRIKGLKFAENYTQEKYAKRLLKGINEFLLYS